MIHSPKLAYSVVNTSRLSPSTSTLKASTNLMRKFDAFEHAACDSIQRLVNRMNGMEPVESDGRTEYLPGHKPVSEVYKRYAVT
jgi:hypothetical protein